MGRWYQNLKKRYQSFRKNVYDRLKRYAASTTPNTFAAAIALGVYIALSPLLGIQTIVAFCVARIFQLPSALVIGVTYAINNPWTMVPILFFDYFVGKKVIALFFQPDAAIWRNPAWFAGIESFLALRLGIAAPSLSAYIIGGNIVGIACAIPTYLFFVRVVRRWQVKDRAVHG